MPEIVLTFVFVINYLLRRSLLRPLLRPLLRLPSPSPSSPVKRLAHACWRVSSRLLTQTAQPQLAGPPPPVLVPPSPSSLPERPRRSNGTVVNSFIGSSAVACFYCGWLSLSLSLSSLSLSLSLPLSLPRSPCSVRLVLLAGTKKLCLVAFAAPSARSPASPRPALWPDTRSAGRQLPLVGRPAGYQEPAARSLLMRQGALA